MIDIKALDNDKIHEGESMTFADYYRSSLKARGEDPGLVDQAIEMNKERKALVHSQETLKAEQNEVGAEIAKRKKAKEDASDLLAKMQEVSSKSKELTQRVDEIEGRLNDFMLRLPNKLHSDVPVGKGEEENSELKKVGEKKTFDFDAKEHWELGEKLDVLDFERGTKVAGARFTFLKGAAARLEMALVQFMLDTHLDEGDYQMIIPPFVVNSQSMQGTGQFPKFKEDVFHLAGTDYYMIPTAEIPVTNLYAGEILAEKDLPQQLVAFSPCFRSEAGSYGKDTKGLIRQHQFNKVELVMFAHPDKSYEMHEKMLSDAEKILQRLELSYRVVTLCSGDIGFGAAKCYDIEVWLPGQKAYREISSCSNCEDFQARRANIRFRPEGAKAKPQFLHTLNGSGLAVGRTLIAILENYQNADGTITVPHVLRKYMGGVDHITPA